MPAPANKRGNNRAYHLKPTRIALKGTSFELNDIGSGGIGVVLEKGGPEFITGERIEKVPLELQSGMVNLKGVVSHISVSTEKIICGIRFLLTGDEFDTVLQFKKELEFQNRNSNQEVPDEERHERNSPVRTGTAGPGAGCSKKL